MNANWLKCACIRAMKTIAQTAIATIGCSTTIGSVDWVLVASASALAGLLSLLTSIVTGLPEVDLESIEIDWSDENDNSESID